MIQRETDLTKQERTTSHDDIAENFKPSSSNSTSSWTKLKDPRIVRVSRAFGGKDRHSKVCTVKGLRDRRVRLSVPTAIQLYDLQDRLGLNQPSKVVDWLLNAAKHEIDELPPLQIPQGMSFSNQFLHPMMLTSHDQLRDNNSQSDKQGINFGGRSNIFDEKLKDVSGETSDRDENWARNEEERHFINLENHGFSANNFPSIRQNPSSLPSLLNSSITPYNQFLRWDPSNLTLSHGPPRSHGLTSNTQQEDWHNFSIVYQQAGISSTTQSNFPSQNAEFDPKQLNFHHESSQLSTSSLSTSPVESTTHQLVRPVHFNMSTANLLPSQNNDDGS